MQADRQTDRRTEIDRRTDSGLENDTADVVAISRPECHLGDAGRRRSELSLTVRQQSAARSRHRRSRCSGGRPRPPGSETAACRPVQPRAVLGRGRSRRSRPCECRSVGSVAG